MPKSRQNQSGARRRKSAAAPRRRKSASATRRTRRTRRAIQSGGWGQAAPITTN